MEKQLWWGYLHTSGTYQAKRYFTPLDIQEDRDNLIILEDLLKFLA